MEYIKKNKLARVLYLSIPLIVALVAIMLKEQIFSLMQWVFPDCFILHNFGVLCPSCGNTRSVQALLSGDFVTSFHSNPIIIVIVLVVLTLYAEGVLYIFGKRVRILPRSKWLLVLLAVIYAVFLVARNYYPILAPT